MRRPITVLVVVLLIVFLAILGWPRPDAVRSPVPSSVVLVDPTSSVVAPPSSGAMAATGGGTPASTPDTAPETAPESAVTPPSVMVGGPGITVERIPVGTFRAAMEALEPPARARALEVLRRHPVPASELSELGVDASGGIFFRRCPIPPVPEAGAPLPSVAMATAPAAILSVSTPPIYHSRPTSSQVVFLDFNGATINERDVAWSTTNPSGQFKARPFSLDADYTTFSDTEQAAILTMWKRVAEDFAAFDIDVTTEDPGTDHYATMGKKIGWVIITDTSDAQGYDLPHAGSGGIAYLGVYDDVSYSYYRPAWVSDYHSTSSLQYMAVACSHEFGHNLGLSHDGTTSSAYYAGHGSGETGWGPIMGAPVKNVDQWSKGDYQQANNPQDDLAIIAASLTYRSDDHGNGLADADPVVFTSATAFSATGIIEAPGDVDAFRVTVGSGPFSATVAGIDSGTMRGTNLAAGLELWTEGGSLVTKVVPTTTMGVTLSTTAAAGTYILKVKPAGIGSPLSSPPSGFTSYGSLGQYTITGTCLGIAAEIEVRGHGQVIAAGSTTPSSTNDTDFGVLTRGGVATRTFTINNVGSSDLTGISSRITGDGFALTALPAATVAPQGSTTFAVTYTAGLGTAAGAVTILSSDRDEGVTTFALQGVGRSAVTLDATTFTEEAITNHGTCPGTLTATLVGDTFSGADGTDLVASGAVVAAGVPTGLILAAIKTSPTTLAITLGGSAVHHDQTDNTTVTLTFTDGAFLAGNAAGHSGATPSLSIVFTGLTVTTGSDTGVDAVLGTSLVLDRSDGAGLSLREALGWTTGGPITFAEGLGTITLGGAQLSVSRSTTIDGGGVITLDANLASRVLVVTGGTVVVRNLTLTRGLVTGAGMVVGGAVAQTGGSLTLDHVLISGSTASSTTYPALGGGISTSAGNLTIVDSTITGCVATTLGYLNAADNARGGAVASLNAAGTITIDGCQISDNGAYDAQVSPTSGRGGGLYAGVAGTLVIRATTFANNVAADAGGGLWLQDTGVVACTGCTWSGNRTRTASGGGGGAIMTQGTAGLTLSNCTVTANTSGTGSGHGIVVGGTRSHSLVSTICAANPAVGALGTDIFLTGTGTLVCDASLISTTRQGRSGSQVISNSASCVDALDPRLSSLGDHGGRGWTHVLQSGSPAAEAGTNPARLTVDQRGSGFPRVVGRAIDIGAVENQQPTLASPATVTVVMSGHGAPIAWSAPALGALDSDTSSPSADLVWSVVTPPAHGTATFTDGSAASLIYLPAVGWSGSDAFTVQVTDGLLAAADLFTITVQVTPPALPAAPVFHAVQVTLRGTVDAGTISLRLGATEVPIASDHTWSITIPAPDTVSTYDLTATSAEGLITVRHLTLSPVTPPGAG